VVASRSLAVQRYEVRIFTVSKTANRRAIQRLRVDFHPLCVTRVTRALIGLDLRERGSNLMHGRQ